LWLHGAGHRVDSAAMLVRHTLAEATYLTMVREGERERERGSERERERERV
jgi:hypothetical protein